MNIEYAECRVGEGPYGGNLMGEIKLRITSGCRCQAHNDKPQNKGGAGGSKTSEHIATPKRRVEGCDIYIDGHDSNAVDGFFYYGKNIKANRIDASDVLKHMWDDELINGLIFYPYQKCMACKGIGLKGFGIPGMGKCPDCGGDGTIKDYRFHMDTGDRRFFDDRRGK